MITLANSEKVLLADLDATKGSVPRGVVLAETEVDFVTWRVSFEAGLWYCDSGVYFPKSAQGARSLAEANYNRRRGVTVNV